MDNQPNCAKLRYAMQTNAALRESKADPLAGWPVGVSLHTPLLEQIQDALEMMKRVRTVHAESTGRALQESFGNTYVVPEPVAFYVSGLTERH